ncbi:MAG TPA: hypothetical protein VF579_02070, partial [Candidatus Methylomirabilis sp.]
MRDESREPRATSHEPRAESRESRVENGEPRAERKGGMGATAWQGLIHRYREHLPVTDATPIVTL